MDNFIDTSKFGVNAFRSKMTQKAGILKISHRGWLFGLFFEIIAAVIIVIIWKSKIEFSGFSILVYFGAFLFFSHRFIICFICSGNKF